MGTPTLQVSVRNCQKALKIAPQAVRQIARHVVKLEGAEYHEVAIHLVDAGTICELHDRYFGDPSLTDCISFPLNTSGDPEPRALGDVFVCPETAIAYAERHNSDAYTETVLYIVHGILHLLGYDDLEPNARRRMRRAEQRHMKALGFR